MPRVPIIQKAIVADRTNAKCLLIVVAALAGATVGRALLSSIGTSVPFATYYPAVLICALLAGWRYGVACTLLSGVLAEVLFVSASDTALDAVFRFPLANFLVFLTSCGIIIAIADALRRALRDLEHVAERATFLNRELQHRVGNMLAVIQALALRSARGTIHEDFATAFGERLRGMSKAHALLGNGSLESFSLSDLVEEACQPFTIGKNILRSGPDCELPGKSCVPLVMALHELCTNAVKHGALSNELGRVDLSWSFSDTPSQVVIAWKETGGPTVSQPTRTGLGSALLRSQTGIAVAKITYESEGFCCWLTIGGAKATYA